MPRPMNEDTGFILFVLTLFLLGVAIITAFMSVSTGTKQSEIGVVMSSGPLDVKRPVELIEPGSGMTVIGVLNKVHRYPASTINRWMSFSSASMSNEAPYFATTKDGFKVGLKGRMYFRFVGEKNKALAFRFDKEFGNREFNGLHPHEGEKGFSNFLDVMVVPVVKNSVRKKVNEVNCSAIDKSCALISESKDLEVTDVRTLEGDINKDIVSSIRQKLGADYLIDFRVSILETELPENVQKQVNFVSVSRSRIKQKELDIKTAKMEAKAIRIRGEALARSPQLACIEAAKVLEDANANVNVIIDGSCSKQVSVVQGGK